MTADPLRHYRQVWACDFEFRALPGDKPEVHCMVAREYWSDRLIRMWADELVELREPPFPIDAESLFVAYYASAEFGCFLQLGWPMPARILDLFTEFRNATNGRPVPCGNGLLGALAHYGLSAIDAAEKTDMRDLAIRGGSFTEAERLALLNYCQSDVDSLRSLLPVMLPEIDLPRALLRGRHMAAVAHMEDCGTPIDVGTLEALRANWGRIKGRLTRAIDRDYGVFAAGAPLEPPEDAPLSFSTERFAQWLIRSDIPWPQLESGALALDDDSFREMAKTYPQVAPLRELRHTLGAMRLFDNLAVGSDGRNRCLLSPFQARSSRNQPSSAKFIFGPSCWLRSLIQPTIGRAVAYVDWSQQEFGIAAALSGDHAMMEAYACGDPYLRFAIQAGAVPPDGTKHTHPQERELFKTCALGVAYGMQEESLARRIDQPPCVARELLRLHRQTYPRFWAWSESAVNRAMLYGTLRTVFGWTIFVGPGVNPRSLANFPMQANGGDMLRLACCLATERGILVCCPVHDALLVEGPADGIEDVVRATQEAMAEASRVVLGGFELRSDANIVRHPERYMDPRGERMWRTVMEILNDLKTERRERETADSHL